MKTERPENHPKMVFLGGSWAAPGVQEAFLQTALLHFGSFWAAPGGVPEPSGELLGALWALLARILALFFSLTRHSSAYD